MTKIDSNRISLNKYNSEMYTQFQYTRWFSFNLNSSIWQALQIALWVKMNWGTIARSSSQCAYLYHPPSRASKCVESVTDWNQNIWSLLNTTRPNLKEHRYTVGKMEQKQKYQDQMCRAWRCF